MPNKQEKKRKNISFYVYKKKQPRDEVRRRRSGCFRLQEGCMMMIFLVPCYVRYTQKKEFNFFFLK